MNNLNKMQKIILTIIAIILILGICYYIYFKDDKDINIIEDNSLEVEETKETQEDNKEEYSDTRIIVYITGAINKEGIYELPIDSRIADLIEKADGIKEEAYIEKLNLAYKLEDGKKVHIPTKQEYEEEQKLQENENTKEDITNKYITTSSGISSIENSVENDNDNNNKNNSNINKKININKATQTELDSLPGIGPSTSIKIIEYREQNGNFKNIEEIKNVSGIGDAKYEKIKDKIEI